MKLLLLNDTGLAGGGAETRTLQLLDHWHKSGVLETLLVLQRTDQGETVKRSYLETFTSSDRAQRGDWIRRQCRENRIDLVQAHNLLTSGSSDFSVVAATGVPLAWFVHDFWAACGNQLLCTTWDERCSGPALLKCARCIGAPSTLRVAMLKRHFADVDVGIVASAYIADTLTSMGIKPKRWAVRDPWIDLDVFAPSASLTGSRAAEVVLYVGPLSRAKGADLALEAFALVKGRRPNAKLRMVGGEPQHGSWAVELAMKLNINQNVEWVGRLDPAALAAEMAKASVLVFPSRCQESFGLTWAQAMAAHCPVVAVETGTIRETLQPNDLARIVSLEPSQIAEAVLATFENSADTARRAKRGYDYTRERLGIERAANGIEALYRELLADRAGRA